MKAISLCLGLLFCSLFSFSQNRTDCASFKTGEFAYRDSSTNSIWTIKRKGRHQTEKDEKNGIVVKKKIEWLSPCEYKLTQTWTNSKDLKKRNFTSLTYSIVTVAGDSYSFSCQCSDGTKLAGTMVKMPG